MRTAEVAPAPQRTSRWRRVWPPVGGMLLLGLALFGFFVYGRQREPIRFGFFSHPPIYGIFDPTIGRLALTVVPAALALAVVAWLAVGSARLPTLPALSLVAICGVALAAAVNVVRGDSHELVKGVSTVRRSPYYSGDLHFIDEYGVRGFVERFPDLVPQFQSYNSKTHPPGVHLLLSGLFNGFGAEHTLRITTAIALMVMCAAVSAWLIGREIGGERAGRIAAVLLAATPGPLLLAYTLMDGVFATLMSLALGLFMLALRRRSAAVAAGAGAVIGLTTLMTYASVFVAVAAAVGTAIQTRSLRACARLLGAAAAGGLAVLGLAYLVLGFDLPAIYAAKPASSTPYDPYWFPANLVAVLTWAGLPVALFGLVGLFQRRPAADRDPDEDTVDGGGSRVLPAVLLAGMVLWATLPSVVTNLRPGEVERTWAFLYPVLAGLAGPAVERWSRRTAGRWAPALVVGLMLLSIGQAVLLQALWRTEVSNV